MKTSITFIIAALLAPVIYAQVPFNQNPNWISTDITNVSTGGTFADINKDGWIDFVVANGNDMAIQKVVVYYNNNGSFPSAPNWQSTDIDYHGHLDAGDINGDGYPEVAVSVYIGQAGFSAKGKVKLYSNTSGTLSANPVWTSADEVYTFSCAFGDADGDGDLDLAVAGGESYNSHPEQPRIYYNYNGVLETLPSWKATAAQYCYDVDWADFDKDGDLDLVFACEGSPNKIFQNVNGVIGTAPMWQSTDVSQQANSLFTGDINGDGYIDLAISDNNQLGGTGKFKLYLNNAGTLSTTPFWTSAFSGYGSGIQLSDIDNDVDLDLLTGGWWQPCRIYTNSSGSFNTNPQYTSTSTSVVEVIITSDVDKDMVQNVQQLFTGNGQKKLFYMPRTPLLEVTRVVIGTDTLQYNEYSYDTENGWISLAVAPAAGVIVSVEGSVSWDLDMGITNWDNNKGNYLFLNTTPHPLFQLSVDVVSGWNMLSIPGLLPSNQNVNTWWPYRDMNANVFQGWGGTYQPFSVAAPGAGYWVKHPAGRTYNTGDEWPAEGIKTYPHLPIRCPQGWSLIGIYEQSISAAALTTTPPGLISGSVYKYQGGYTTAATLEPGYGYWVKLTGAGSINIPSGTLDMQTAAAKNNNDASGKIIITDNAQNSYTLYAAADESDLTQYDLPPAPPAGIFDVRYSSQRSGERIGVEPKAVEMSGIEFPVRIKAEGIDIILADETGREIAVLKSGEEYVLNSLIGKLFVSGNTVPSVYSLNQNYPNPFNPATTIEFSIPEDVQNIKLTIYNALGENVAELVNKELRAGTYKYTWNAENFASGIYIYQLVTERFVSTKKMMYVK
jgi:hypothetical protein